ncbi:lipid IV(A) 3-deoxy-D-manno-octulosonic acid transferase [Stutzerimonas tarimensis]|uniref:3-deoxy-D-manno-octulosonic acid transferase n=1 Tax=Stutzerimonas tarimensis TaxID=1507735 RepID=A0ABV7T7Z5_9GAMM
MNRSLYSILFHLALPIIALRLLLRGRRAPAYRRRIGERFAVGLPAFQPGGIWVHAVSVGESIAAAPMIRALMERYPELPVTVTCMTPTGSDRIRALFGDQVQHCYLPYDLPWASARFLDRLRPKVAIIMETELWPNHVHQCSKRGIATILANGRLSERSARGYARLAKLTGPMLAEMSWIAVQTETEAERFRQLGASPDSISVTGSIKFDISVDPELPARAAAQRQGWGSRPVWIAASTHAGEDEIVLEAHRRLLTERQDALLILVPRHPERFDSVFGLCQRASFPTQRRTTGDAVTESHQVLLGDTMGELLYLYALADVAFVGGSLVPIGGHNPLEPVALGLPILTGPHLFNFAEITEQLREPGVLRVLQTAEELHAAVSDLLADASHRDALATAGRQVLGRNQGALERLIRGISQRLH